MIAERLQDGAQANIKLLTGSSVGTGHRSGYVPCGIRDTPSYPSLFIMKHIDSLTHPAPRSVGLLAGGLVGLGARRIVEGWDLLSVETNRNIRVLTSQRRSCPEVQS